MRKGICVFSCLCLVFSLSGCWDYKELNQAAIITGIAIDKGKKNKYKLTVEKLNTLELNPRQASGNAPSIIHSLEGESISDMMQKMNIGLSKKIVLSHMRTAVISEDIAREGVLDFFDFLERYREIREDFNVVVAKGAHASDVLKISYPIQKVSTLKLHMQLNNAVDEWGADPDIRKKDIINSWASEGRQPVTAAVTINGPVKKGNSVENMKQLAPPAMVELYGIGILKAQKLIGFLPVEDTRNYLWTQNKLKLTSLAVPCGKNKFLTVRVFRTNSAVKTAYRFNVPHIGLKINVESQLIATQCKEDLDKIKTYQDLERKIENYIRQDVTGTIHKVQQKYKVDIFGFGEDMERQNYRLFNRVKNKWDQEFSRAKIEVNATVTLRRAGVRTKSFLSDIK